jgi:hypothetical protein
MIQLRQINTWTLARIKEDAVCSKSFMVVGLIAQQILEFVLREENGRAGSVS